MKIIARILTDFDSKFGIPRQSGLVSELEGRIVFEPEFRSAEALRGLEGFSHIWLIWGFSENEGKPWSPTVRPPRLGGNVRMGVFATRSPVRPNPIGLSVVRLKGIEYGTSQGPVLTVSGVDMKNGTPIYDIKPYVAYTDSAPDAKCAYAADTPTQLSVRADEKLLQKLPPDKRSGLIKVLSMDPRPHYHSDPQRIYGFSYAGKEIKFRVEDDEVFLVDIE